jgi:hypothetical protein
MTKLANPLLETINYDWWMQQGEWRIKGMPEYDSRLMDERTVIPN